MIGLPAPTVQGTRTGPARNLRPSFRSNYWDRQTPSFIARMIHKEVGAAAPTRFAPCKMQAIPVSECFGSRARSLCTQPLGAPASCGPSEKLERSDSHPVPPHPAPLTSRTAWCPRSMCARSSSAERSAVSSVSAEYGFSTTKGSAPRATPPRPESPPCPPPQPPAGPRCTPCTCSARTQPPRAPTQCAAPGPADARASRPSQRTTTASPAPLRRSLDPASSHPRVPVDCAKQSHLLNRANMSPIHLQYQCPHSRKATRLAAEFGCAL